jgi:hypothetical protein
VGALPYLTRRNRANGRRVFFLGPWLRHQSRQLFSDPPQAKLSCFTRCATDPLVRFALFQVWLIQSLQITSVGHLPGRVVARQKDRGSWLRSEQARARHAQATGSICRLCLYHPRFTFDWHSFSGPSLSGGRRLSQGTSDVFPAFQNSGFGFSFPHRRCAKQRASSTTRRWMRTICPPRPFRGKHQKNRDLGAGV